MILTRGLNKGLEVSESEVRAELDRRGGKAANSIEYLLRPIVFVAPLNATPEQIQARMRDADAFRANPAFDTRTVIGELAVGEALVSTLDEGGVPLMVQRVLVRPPVSRMGPLSDSEREVLLRADPLHEIGRAHV